MAWRKKQNFSVCPPHNYEIINVRAGSGQYGFVPNEEDVPTEYTSPTVILTKRCTRCGDTYTDEEIGYVKDYEKY